MRQPMFEYFESKNQQGINQWYWRLKDGNSKIIAIGAEPFYSKPNVQRAIRNVKATVPFATSMKDVTVRVKLYN